MNKLFETYQKRLAVSDSISVSKTGEPLSNTGKMLVATMLNNTNRFLNESFEHSVGTQRADLGMYKRFCLNLVTVAVN